MNTDINGFVWQFFCIVAFVVSTKSWCFLNFCIKGIVGALECTTLWKMQSLSLRLLSLERFNMDTIKLNLKYRLICSEFQRDGTSGSFYKDVKNWKPMSQILPTDFSF